MLRGAKRQGGTGSDTFIALAKTAGRHHRFFVGAHGYWWWHIIRAALGCRRARHAPRRGNFGLSEVIIAVPAAVGFMIGGWSIPDLPPFTLGYVHLLALAVMIPASMLGARRGAVCHLMSAASWNWFSQGFFCSAAPAWCSRWSRRVRAFGRIHRPLQKTTIIRQWPQTWRAYFI